MTRSYIAILRRGMRCKAACRNADSQLPKVAFRWKAAVLAEIDVGWDDWPGEA